MAIWVLILLSIETTFMVSICGYGITSLIRATKRLKNRS